MLPLRSLIAAALLVTTAVSVPETVDLGYTSYIGITIPDGISQWMGMRYAAAPLGDLRFMPPQNPTKEDRPQFAHEVR